jgi:hypothetical protein
MFVFIDVWAADLVGKETDREINRQGRKQTGTQTDNTSTGREEKQRALHREGTKTTCSPQGKRKTSLR